MPGITGLWQVSGRNDIADFERWIDLDLEYAHRWSLWLDLRILGRTVRAVVRREGIQGVGEATMAPFRGSAPS